MSDKYSPDSAALQDKLERIAALQQAIEQASHEVQVAQSLQPEEQQLMLRILAQRRRLRQRAAQAETARERRPSRRGWAGDNTRASAWGGAGASSANASANASANTGGAAASLMQSVPWLAEAQDLAMRRPVAVGLALGASLVIIGPRRLVRSMVWWTPFLWRSLRVARRVHSTLNKR